MEPLISLQDVCVQYKRSGNILKKRSYFEALKSVNLDIYPGETLGILGRNGAGKSTLLRIISGVIKPDNGKVINRGATVSLLALQAGFDPNLNGHDNAILSAMLQGYTRKEVESHLKEIQEYSELGDFFYEPVRTYSTGMTARLGFSISTITSPDVLLIDEALSVGDQSFREKAERTMIAKLHSNQTIVFVSHSHRQVSRLCDRVVIIDKGKTISQGEPYEMIHLYEERLSHNKT